MINWLIQQSIMVSTIIFVITLYKLLNLHYLGSRGVYRLWTLIPVSMAAGALPDWQQTQGVVVNYLVSVKQTSQQISVQLVPISDVLVALWVIVMAGLVSLLVLSHYRHKKTLIINSTDTNCALFSLTNRQSITLNNLSVKSSDLALSPYITGIVRPTLVLPLDFFKCFDEQQQSLILNHELHHFKSGDLLWNCVAQLVVIIFWFNPLCWYAYLQYRHQQELACDQSVLQLHNKSTRLAYARAMLLCHQQQKSIPLTYLNYGAKNTMHERISLLKQHKPTPVWRWLATGGVLFGAVLSINLASADVTLDGKHDVYPIYRIEPQYPVMAEQNNTQGSVILSFDIESDGSVENVTIVNSEPKPIFDHSAKEALQQWKYETHGKKLLAQLVQLDFVLQGAIDEQGLESYDGKHERIKVTK
jgi:bla regulator protein BlaR1